jgi:hypothetical protein
MSDHVEQMMEWKIKRWQMALEAYRAAKAVEQEEIPAHADASAVNGSSETLPDGSRTVTRLVVAPPRTRKPHTVSPNGQPMWKGILIEIDNHPAGLTNMQIGDAMRAIGWDVKQANVASALAKLKANGVVAKGADEKWRHAALPMAGTGTR